MKTQASEWTTSPLGQVANLVMGQSPESKFYSEEEAGLAFLQGCAEFQARFPKHAVYCRQIKKIAPENSILFSVRAPVGRINIADQAYIIGRGLAAITGIDVEQDYLEQYLHFEESNFRNVSQGSTFEAINSSELSTWPIKHPTDKPEQSKIAEVLSKVDQAIEQTESLIAKQQRIKTGLMQDLLTRGIDEHGNLRSEETHEFKDSPLGRIPVEWEVSNFRNITEVNQGLQIAIEKRFKSEGPKRHKYITIQYLNNPEKNIEYIDTPPANLICKQDDVLFTRTGNTGQIVTGIEGVYHNNFFKIAFDKNKIIHDFLITFLCWEPIQEQIKELAGTTTIPDLNHGDFYALPLLLPDIVEQERLMGVLSKQITFVNSEIGNLKKLRSLKTALMQDLLTGKVRVTPLMENMEVCS
ncbi:MAG: restriction endonuclease subunit S [SAR324 cluster bacterium]|nr:restriction endonuclease subunit S [SAR324 cluster bacterium]